jgi:hypothetical protein
VISYDADTVKSSKRGNIRARIMRRIFGALERRNKKARIAQPGAPAMLRNLGLMDSEDNVLVKPFQLF